MLSEFCILLFFSISILGYRITHSFFHPAVIVSLSWALLLFAYHFFDHGLFPLSDKFFFAVLLWVIGFCIASLWHSKKRILLYPPLYTRSFKVPFLRKVINLFIVINIIGILAFYNLSGGIAYHALVEFTTGAEELPIGIRILQFLQVVSTTLYAILVLYGKQINVSRVGTFLFVVTIFIWAGIAANKTGLFQLIAISLVAAYYHNKLSFIKSLFVVALMSIAFYGLQSMRAESVGGKKVKMEDMVLTYVLSPMPAFDMVLNGEKQFAPGQTWRFFSAIANKFGMGEQYDQGESGWANVPVLTNVYTVMCPYYVDFGYWGIFIFSLILGGGWGILYNEMKRGTPLFTVLYVMLFHTLVLQFFADYIVNYLSMVIQINIFVAILLLHFKKVKYLR